MTDEPHLLSDPAKLKALAHPMRRAMLRHLGAHGPATSTTLGELLGSNTGTTSYHLRQLEKYGFIEEIPERSTGRERWWRRAEATRDLRHPDPRTLTPEARETLAQFQALALEEDHRLLDGLPAAYDRDPDRVKAARGTTWMTAQEFADFFAAYATLLKRYGHRAEDAPPGARLTHLRLYALPATDARPDDTNQP